MVSTASNLLCATIGLAIREAAASAAAHLAACLEVRRVASIVEDHLVDAGGLLSADELAIKYQKRIQPSRITPRICSVVSKDEQEG